jgi:hypothetical protein
MKKELKPPSTPRTPSIAKDLDFVFLGELGVLGGLIHAFGAMNRRTSVPSADFIHRQ